jgi:hypothetical protein
VRCWGDAGSGRTTPPFELSPTDDQNIAAKEAPPSDDEGGRRMSVPTSAKRASPNDDLSGGEVETAPRAHE